MSHHYSGPNFVFPRGDARLDQTATVRRLEGRQAAGTGEGGGGQLIVGGAPVSMGLEAQVTEAGDYRFFAGWRSDPFFFDGGALNAFLTLITNGKVTGDGIGPHPDLLDEFPYLGPPHSDRSLETQSLRQREVVESR